MNSLFEIKNLAESNLEAAQVELLMFVRKNFPELGAVDLKINRSKLSLNSVNGFIKVNNPGPHAKAGQAGAREELSASEKYFFKFHTEEDEEKTLAGSEYYNAELLADKGLRVVQPVKKCSLPGQQFVVYPKIEARTAFEAFAEMEKLPDSSPAERQRRTILLNAEKEYVQDLSRVILDSLRWGNCEKAPINQLFYHRLEGENPRVDNFYQGKKVFCGGRELAFPDLARKKWKINGVYYQESLEEIIQKAKKLLRPGALAAQGCEEAIVIGHGDDHNGNKFFIDGKFWLFDPAVAGWQPALLSFVKATAHNVFLHPLWLYDAEKINAEDLKLRICTDVNFSEQKKTMSRRQRFDNLKAEKMGDRNIVEVTYNWPITHLRREIIDIYVKNLWRRLIAEMRARDMLAKNWKDYLRKAFFCCPFLVRNLLSLPSTIADFPIFALAKCVELGTQPLGKMSEMEKFLQAIDGGKNACFFQEKNSV